MYIGNDLQIAHPSYKIIDDISSGFNGSTTSFALQVNGSTPVPFPISTQQVMISVNGVVQEPDPTGNAGFKLLGSNIVFSSAPANGHAFFGVINAGADYVTAGSEFPDGSATAPSFTFQDDQDTGWFRSGSGAVGYSANGAQTLTFDGNGLTVTGDASFVGDSAKNLLWDKSDGALEFADNAKAVFGTGSDLKLFHDGSHSYIQDSGTGNLNIDASSVFIRNATGTENIAKFIQDGAVELFYDGSKKLETYSSGINLSGDIRLPDANTAYFGTDNDLWVMHNGSTGYISNSTGDLYIRDNDGDIYIQGKSGENSIKVLNDSAVELFFDNDRKFKTLTNGAQVESSTGDTYLNVVAEEDANSADARVRVYTTNTSAVAAIVFGDASDTDRGWVKYQNSNDSMILRTNAVDALTLDSSQNATFAGDIDLADDKKLLLGAGDDLQIYHRSSDESVVIKNANDTGFLRILSGDTDSSGILLKNANDDVVYLRAKNHDGVELFFNDSKKFETTATGVTVSGKVIDVYGGDVRRAIQTTKSSAHTLVATDQGKHIHISSGGVTVPNNVLTDGDMVTIVNNSGSNQTITQGTGVTMYLPTDATTGNRTLAGRGVCTILFTSASVCYISGAGLS